MKLADLKEHAAYLAENFADTSDDEPLIYVGRSTIFDDDESLFTDFADAVVKKSRRKILYREASWDHCSAETKNYQRFAKAMIDLRTASTAMPDLPVADYLATVSDKIGRAVVEHMVEFAQKVPQDDLCEF